MTVRYHVNVARVAHGLKPLRRSHSLRLSAKLFAIRLAHRRLAHDPTIHVDRAWVWAGEVLARGQQIEGEVVRDWLASPAHRAILLSPNARAIGAAHHRKSKTWVAHLGKLGK